jgi:hypothetical protein
VEKVGSVGSVGFVGLAESVGCVGGVGFVGLDGLLGMVGTVGTVGAVGGESRLELFFLVAILEPPQILFYWFLVITFARSRINETLMNDATAKLGPF